MMKRSSDGHYGSSNGNKMNNSNNDAKKARLDSAGPSRVLHIRGVPGDATEAEIVQLGIPFGRMTNLLLARKKNQALLEMADVSTAEAMYNYYSEKQPQVRGRTVHVQYSNHQELKTEADLPVNAGAQAALEAADNLLSSGGMEGGQPHTVLRILIDNMQYPITVDILHKIFSKVGQVMKIVTFTKNNQFQSLLQYSDPIAAQTAKQTLNGQNIYNGCCTLRIDISKLTELSVKYNNERGWDYTNPNLPSGDMGSTAPQPLMDDGLLGSYDGGFGGMGGGMGLGAAGLRNFIPSLTALGNLGLPGAMGAMGGLGLGLGGMGGGMGRDYGRDMDRDMDRHRGRDMDRGMDRGMGRDRDFGGRSRGRMDMDSRGGSDGQGTVIIVSNLYEEKMTPDAIFALFGSYGNVMRVKILFNKKDTALVQYSDPMMAQNAITQLDRCSWYGKSMKISLSKHSYVQMPKEDASDAWMTKDFSNSPLNRFRSPKAKSFTSVAYPPSNTLHLSSIAPNVTEDELRDLFSEHGNVVAFRFFPNDSKMALIQMETQDEAICALVGMHNYELQPRQHLRVSFTKSVI